MPAVFFFLWENYKRIAVISCLMKAVPPSVSMCMFDFKFKCNLNETFSCQCRSWWYRLYMEQVLIVVCFPTCSRKEHLIPCHLENNLLDLISVCLDNHMLREVLGQMLSRVSYPKAVLLI